MALKKGTTKSTPKKAANKKSSTTKSATKKTPGTKSMRKQSAKKSSTPPSRRWSARVTTDSTKPAPGVFKRSGKAIAENLSKKSVSPKGPGQAMQMLSFYENRAGKNLPEERKHALETAKTILRRKEQRVTKPTARKSTRTAK